VHELNQVNVAEKKRIRKQVIGILSEVIDQRQASVKNELAKELNIKKGASFSAP